MSADTSTSDDIFRILLATDIHLGYAEKDPIRGDDSFNTFEEILQLAQDKDVDFILLGGDLFHDSKPSPLCLHKCITLLRKYCMGDKPICVEFLSNQYENFKHCVNPIVNYEDPNLNISIPVYSIHGNHDDPAGFGRLSSLDLLSASGLVNYFGKWTDLSKIEINPLLMRKGRSKLAIYGLSYIKDERLSRLFRDGMVTAVRPADDPDSWMSIFVLHQNRADRGPNNFISEKMIPDFIDLVMWGHEHECRIEPEWNDERGFFVTQPGSPVATSLCEGEAVPKHVALLSVMDKKFKVSPIKLETVRPFAFDTLVLSKSSLRDQDNCHQKDRILSYVSERVENMLESVTKLLTGHIHQPTLPLIRLRVEYTGEDEIFNAIRFGQRFTNRVANPTDLILLKREPAKTREKAGDHLDKDAIRLAFEQGVMIGGGIEAAMDIQAILGCYFEETDEKNLKVLSVKGMAEAVTEFIDKDNKEAIDNLVEYQVERTAKFVEKEVLSEDAIPEAIESFRQIRLGKGKEEDEEVRKVLSSQNRSTKDKDVSNPMDISSEDDLDSVSTGRGKKVGGSPPKRGRGSRGGRGGAARGTRGTARGRGRGASAASTLDTSGFNSSRQSTRSAASTTLNVTRTSQRSVADMFNFKPSQPSPSKRRKMEFESDSD